MQLNLCKSCPLIQLIDFAVISHSAALPFYPFHRVFSASQRTLDGSRMVIVRLRQVFRLSAAQDNMRLVHEGEKAATQASLIHLAGGPRMALLLAEYEKKIIHQLARGVQVEAWQNSKTACKEQG